jgi:hypothetical protein
MKQTLDYEQLRQESLKQEEEMESWLKELEGERNNRANFFTLSVILWIFCFFAMMGSLIYKETCLIPYSDDWRFFSAIHVITALICIFGVTYYNLTTQEVFDKDVLEIDKYKETTPLMLRENRVYANDREQYERTLERFQDRLKLAKFFYFFGIIALATIFFVWDITQYFLVPDAYVVSLSSDPGWKTTAYQIYFPGLFIAGGSVLASVMIREFVKMNAQFYTMVLHIGGLITTMLKNVIKSRSE